MQMEHDNVSGIGDMDLVFQHITDSLAKNYISIYYVDLNTNGFVEYKSDEEYKKLKIEESGDDFFLAGRINAMKFIYDNDLEKFLSDFNKENIKKAVSDGSEFSLSYRMKFGETLRYVSLKVISIPGDLDHAVIGIADIDDLMKQRRERATFSRIAEALAKDCFSLYYVNLVTDEFLEYSADDRYDGLDIEKRGQDFFNLSRKNALRVICKDDHDKFYSLFTKNKLIRAMEQDGAFQMTYRIMLNGEPIYVSMKATLIESEDGGDRHAVFGISNVDAQIRNLQNYKKAHEESLTFGRIAESLAADYFSIYYVDLDTDDFIEYSSNEDYKKLKVQTEGHNFFEVSYENCKRVIFQEDQEEFFSMFTRENIIKELAQNGSFSMEYRIMFEDGPRYVRMKITEIDDNGGKHMVIGVSNVDAEKKRLMEYQKAREESLTFASIAESLAKDYFSIYYVDTRDDTFIEYSSSEEYKKLNIETKGEDFFNLSRKNSEKIVYPDDFDRLMTAFTKERLLKALEDSDTFTINYRLMFGDEARHVSLKATRMKDSSDPHIVIGVSSIDAQVKREQEITDELNIAMEMANRDPLTGVKSKHAYYQKEHELDTLIESKSYPEFGIVVCDVNDLKRVNDTLGHAEGDKLIVEACHVICDIFDHSPVYRMGGDEFAVILQGGDLENRDELMELMHQKMEEHKENGKLTIASGLSVFEPGKNHSVSEIFELADHMMYDNKKIMKGAENVR